MITNNKVIFSTFSLFKNFLEELRKVNDAINQTKYSIISYEEESGKIKVQIMGKNQYFYMNATEIVVNNMIMDFPKKDAILITHLATLYKLDTRPRSSMKYKFMGLVRSLTGQRTQFKVMNKSGDVECKVCSEALFDPTLLATASDKEKIEIGYIAGYEEHKMKTNYS